MRDERTDPVVAEMQGLEGAFSFPERLLQKVWLRGDFSRAAAGLRDGRRLRVLYPGKWNPLGGPDFTGARLRLGEVGEGEVTGDVEVHLHAGDWDAHRHAQDPAYEGVVLHVVLFPPEAAHVTRGAGGREIPVLVLLPLLHHSLEELAADEAVEKLADRAWSRLPDELGARPAGEIAGLLRRQAEVRWRQKVGFARRRVERLGWEAACHHAALEILGYRFNRAPMLRLAGEYPLAEWVAGRVNPDTLYEGERASWSVQGVRPANQPRTRLRQYAGWVQARPDWPECARALARALPAIAPAEETRVVRRRHRLTERREQLAESLCAQAVGGPRFDNLMCDGVLPLLAVETGCEVEGLWHHWFPGDLPPMLNAGLRQVGVVDGRRQPACHGIAQGLLGWLLEREAQQVAPIRTERARRRMEAGANLKRFP